MVTKDALTNIFKHLDNGMDELSKAISLLPKDHILRLELGTAIQKVWKVQGSVHTWLNEVKLDEEATKKIEAVKNEA